METTTGETATADQSPGQESMETLDKGAMSPLTGSYLLIVLAEPQTEEDRDIIIKRLTKGLRSWDLESTHVDLSCELLNLANAAPESDEARNGEKLVQWASENLVVEVLIHCQVNTLQQCMKNLLSSFTRHRHIIHAGYTFQGSGSWILQDGTFSFADFMELWDEPEIHRLLGAYGSEISVSIHCAEENGWTDDILGKEFSKMCQVSMNPEEKISGHSSGIVTFVDYVGNLLIHAPLKNILEPSDIVGNIRFSHPTLYVFPGGQGDAALFGVNGFNMLIDGGFSRRSCFWDFTRHLDRLDAVLLTRINNNSVAGLSSLMDRKRLSQVYPQIGHFFGNVMERKGDNADDEEQENTGDQLCLSLKHGGQRLLDNLKSINLKPHHCFRDHTMDPINLYHKVGHGKLDMYVLNPAKDSKEVKEFLSKWNTGDSRSFVQAKMSVKVEGKEMNYPVLNLVSICALLVWQPDNPREAITRILFPGSTPQQKIFEALGKLKHLEFLKYPVCSAKTIAAAHKSRSKSERVVSEARSYIKAEGGVRAPSESRAATGVVRSTISSTFKSKAFSSSQKSDSSSTIQQITEEKKEKGRERSREKKRVVSSSKDNKEQEAKKQVKSRVDSGLPSTTSRSKSKSSSTKNITSPPSGTSTPPTKEGKKYGIGASLSKHQAATSSKTVAAPPKAAKEASNRKVISSTTVVKKSSSTEPKSRITATVSKPPPPAKAAPKSNRPTTASATRKSVSGSEAAVAVKRPSISAPGKKEEIPPSVEKSTDEQEKEMDKDSIEEEAAATLRKPHTNGMGSVPVTESSSELSSLEHNVIEDFHSETERNGHNEEEESRPGTELSTTTTEEDIETNRQATATLTTAPESETHTVTEPEEEHYDEEDEYLVIEKDESAGAEEIPQSQEPQQEEKEVGEEKAVVITPEPETGRENEEDIVANQELIAKTVSASELVMEKEKEEVEENVLGTTTENENVEGKDETETEPAEKEGEEEEEKVEEEPIKQEESSLITPSQAVSSDKLPTLEDTAKDEGSLSPAKSPEKEVEIDRVAAAKSEEKESLSLEKEKADQPSQEEVSEKEQQSHVPSSTAEEETKSDRLAKDDDEAQDEGPPSPANSPVKEKEDEGNAPAEPPADEPLTTSSATEEKKEEIEEKGETIPSYEEVVVPEKSKLMDEQPPPYQEVEEKPIDSLPASVGGIKETKINVVEESLISKTEEIKTEDSNDKLSIASSISPATSVKSVQEKEEDNVAPAEQRKTSIPDVQESEEGEEDKKELTSSPIPHQQEDDGKPSEVASEQEEIKEVPSSLEQPELLAKEESSIQVEKVSAISKNIEEEKVEEQVAVSSSTVPAPEEKEDQREENTTDLPTTTSPESTLKNEEKEETEEVGKDPSLGEIKVEQVAEDKLSVSSSISPARSVESVQEKEEKHEDIGDVVDAKTSSPAPKSLSQEKLSSLEAVSDEKEIQGEVEAEQQETLPKSPEPEPGNRSPSPSTTTTNIPPSSPGVQVEPEIKEAQTPGELDQASKSTQEEEKELEKVDESSVVKSTEKEDTEGEIKEEAIIPSEIETASKSIQDEPQPEEPSISPLTKGEEEKESKSPEPEIKEKPQPSGETEEVQVPSQPAQDEKEQLSPSPKPEEKVEDKESVSERKASITSTQDDKLTPPVPMEHDIKTPEQEDKLVAAAPSVPDQQVEKSATQEELSPAKVEEKIESKKESVEEDNSPKPADKEKSSGPNSLSPGKISGETQTNTASSISISEGRPSSAMEIDTEILPSEALAITQILLEKQQEEGDEYAQGEEEEEEQETGGIITKTEQEVPTTREDLQSVTETTTTDIRTEDLDLALEEHRRRLSAANDVPITTTMSSAEEKVGGDIETSRESQFGSVNEEGDLEEESDLNKPQEAVLHFKEKEDEPIMPGGDDAQTPLVENIINNKKLDDVADKEKVANVPPRPIVIPSAVPTSKLKQEVVRTPDEVADLPVHEEVDNIALYEEQGQKEEKEPEGETEDKGKDEGSTQIQIEKEEVNKQLPEDKAETTKEETLPPLSTKIDAAVSPVLESLLTNNKAEEKKGQGESSGRDEKEEEEKPGESVENQGKGERSIEIAKPDLLLASEQNKNIANLVVITPSTPPVVTSDDHDNGKQPADKFTMLLEPEKSDESSTTTSASVLTTVTAPSKDEGVKPDDDIAKKIFYLEKDEEDEEEEEEEDEGVPEEEGNFVPNAVETGLMTAANTLSAAVISSESPEKVANYPTPSSTMRSSVSLSPDRKSPEQEQEEGAEEEEKEEKLSSPKAKEEEKEEKEEGPITSLVETAQSAVSTVVEKASETVDVAQSTVQEIEKTAISQLRLSSEVEHQICDSMKGGSNQPCDHKRHEEKDDDSLPGIEEQPCTKSEAPKPDIPTSFYEEGKENEKKEGEIVHLIIKKEGEKKETSSSSQVSEIKVKLQGIQDPEAVADLERQIVSPEKKETEVMMHETEIQKQEIQGNTTTTTGVSYYPDESSHDSSSCVTPKMQSTISQEPLEQTPVKKPKELSDYLGTMREAKGVFDNLLKVAKSGAALSSAVDECRLNAQETIRRHLEAAEDIYRPVRREPQVIDSPDNEDEEMITVYENLEQMAKAGSELFASLVERVEKEIEEKKKAEERGEEEGEKDEEDQTDNPPEGAAEERRSSTEAAVNAALQHLHETFKAMQAMGSSPKRSSAAASKLMKCPHHHHDHPTEQEDSSTASSSAIGTIVSSNLGEPSSTLKSPDEDSTMRDFTESGVASQSEGTDDGVVLSKTDEPITKSDEEGSPKSKSEDTMIMSTSYIMEESKGSESKAGEDEKDEKLENKRKESVEEEGTPYSHAETISHSQTETHQTSETSSKISEESVTQVKTEQVNRELVSGGDASSTFTMLSSNKEEQEMFSRYEDSSAQMYKEEYSAGDASIRRFSSVDQPKEDEEKKLMRRLSELQGSSGHEFDFKKEESSSKVEEMNVTVAVSESLTQQQAQDELRISRNADGSLNFDYIHPDVTPMSGGEEDPYSSGEFTDSSIPTQQAEQEETDEEVHNFEIRGESSDMDNGNLVTNPTTTSSVTVSTNSVGGNNTTTTTTSVSSISTASPSAAADNGNNTNVANNVTSSEVSRTVTTTSRTVGGQNPFQLQDWEKPLGLPVVYPNEGDGSGAGGTETPKKQTSSTPAKDSSSRGGGRTTSRRSTRHAPIYVDLTYVPHHGNSHYCDSEFFRMIRARYYVFSGLEPSREVFEGLLQGKQQWEDKNLETTIIPTYDTDTLGYWVVDSEKELASNKIDLAPSASRCTINLQDHETSCAAYRLEF